MLEATGAALGMRRTIASHLSRSGPAGGRRLFVTVP
jgi:hypothetical protein